MAGDMDPSEVQKQIGARIRKIREDRGMSQYQLADRAGLSYTYISDVENGKRDARVTTLSKIAKVLKVPLSAIQPIPLDDYMPFRSDIMELAKRLTSMDLEESKKTTGMILYMMDYPNKSK